MKKIICLFLTAVLFVTSLPLSVFAEDLRGGAPVSGAARSPLQSGASDSGGTAAVGDIDGDGEPATPRDAMYLARYIAGWDDYDRLADLSAADIDADGEPATLKDAIILARYIAGWTEYKEYFERNDGNRCGDDLFWEITDDGRLIIKGEGFMWDYSDGDVPWKDRGDEITAVYLPWGLMAVAGGLFTGGNVEKVYIPSTVYRIDEGAFAEGAVIYCDEYSDAMDYAEANGIEWADCEGWYDQDKQKTISEFEDGMFSFDGFDMDFAEPMSEDDAADDEDLEFIREYNALVERENEIIRGIEGSADEIKNTLNRTVDVLSQSSSTISDSTITFNVGNMSLVLDRDIIENNISFDNVSECNSSDGSFYYILSYDSNIYAYLYKINNTTYLTKTCPDSAKKYPIKLSAPSVDINAEALHTLILELEGYVSNISGWFQRRLDSLIEEIGNLENRNQLLEKRAEWLRRRIPNATTDNWRRQYEDLLARTEAEIAENTARIERTNLIRFTVAGLRTAFTALNIGLSIRQLLIITAHWRTIEEISRHEHPQPMEYTYSEGCELSNILNRDINSLRIIYVTDIIGTVTTLVAAVAAFLFATGTIAAMPAALAGVQAVNFTVQLLLSGLHSIEVGFYGGVCNTDNILHTYVYGWVKDKETNKPISGVNVFDGKNAAVTDQNGYYELHVDSGSVELSFKHKQYKEDKKIILITTGEANHMSPDMLLEPFSGSIIGVVYDEDTRLPIPEAAVVCGDQTVLTDSDGNFSIDMAPGEYEIVVSREGYVTSDTRHVIVEKDHQSVVDIPLKSRVAIHNREELEAVTWDGNYYIANDFDLGGEPWTPLPWFSGSLDGCGHTISGMRLNAVNDGNTGLFGGLYQGEVFDLTLADVDIRIPIDSAFTNVGGIGGGLNGGSSLRNVHVSGVITVANGSAYNATAYVGGLIGLVRDGSEMTKCGTNVSISVSSNYTVFAGGVAGQCNTGTVTDCSAVGSVSVTQTGSASDVKYFAYGTSYFDTDYASGGFCSGSVTVTTTKGRGYAFGVSSTDNAVNYATVKAVTDSGTADAYGCFEGENNINYGGISAESGSGQCEASGIRGIYGGTNEADIRSSSSNGSACSGGAVYGGGAVINNGEISARSEKGRAVAFGVKEGEKCSNSGSVSAISYTDALAIGMQSCSHSHNSGSVTAECGKGKAVGQAISLCKYSGNSGSVTVTYTGESGEIGGCSAQGLNNCFESSNAGDISGHVLATTTPCTVTAATGGGGNKNYGRIEAVSETGQANARGVWEDGSENHGEIFAVSNSENLNSNDNVTATGVGAFKNSHNTGSVTALSKSGIAYAYGYDPGASDCTSTGFVSAESEYYYIQTNEDGSQEGGFGFAYAMNSTQVTAKVGPYTVTASGGNYKYMYFFLAKRDCEDHKGMERRLCDGSVDGKDMDGCYIKCGMASSVAEGQ